MKKQQHTHIRKSREQHQCDRLFSAKKVILYYVNCFLLSISYRMFNRTVQYSSFSKSPVCVTKVPYDLLSSVLLKAQFSHTNCSIWQTTELRTFQGLSPWERVTTQWSVVTCTVNVGQLYPVYKYNQFNLIQWEIWAFCKTSVEVNLGPENQFS